MVGGIVIEIIPLSDKVWVNTRERDSTTECAVYVERNSASMSISEGDSLWWQGGYCMWTAKDRKGKRVGPEDYRLEKLSGSGVPRP